MAIIKTKKTQDSIITLEQIEDYLKIKKWTPDAGEYRSPDNGKIGIRLSDGEQNVINYLELFEKRDSFLIHQEIVRMGRNQ